MTSIDIECLSWNALNLSPLRQVILLSLSRSSPPLHQIPHALLTHRVPNLCQYAVVINTQWSAVPIMSRLYLPPIWTRCHDPVADDIVPLHSGCLTEDCISERVVARSEVSQQPLAHCVDNRCKKFFFCRNVLLFENVWLMGGSEEFL